MVDKNVSIWDYESSIYTPKPRSKRAGSRNLLQNSWFDPEVLLSRPKNRAIQIDNYSRIVFPGLFLAFMLFYWPILLLKSEAKDQYDEDE